jgi:triphosphoribosyl-dephospho-CoA synthase
MRPLSIGQCATLACLLEASAPKPGNVHRGADFDDLTFYDFIASAVAIGSAMETAVAVRLGPTVLAAVRDVDELTGTNVSLGTILLLAPLAMVPRDELLQPGVARVLAHLDADDARMVYEAIRLARPGGLGQVEEADVHGPPPDDLIAAMRLACQRDLVARQYAHDFAEVLDFVAPTLGHALQQGRPLVDAIIHAHVETMATFPDSLITRKCGADVARQAAARARAVRDAGPPGSPAYLEALADLDFWLRSDGHRRNPGTTADLIAAGLFVLLRDGIIKYPLRFG